MKRFSSIVVVLLIFSGAVHGQSFQIDRPPTAQDYAKIADDGFPSARNQLEAQLKKNYQLQKTGFPQKNSSVTDWLDLWGWCDLLSQDSSIEYTSLIQRHFFRRPKSNELLLCGPGQTPPNDAYSIDIAEATRMASAPEVKRAIISSLLPPGSSLESGSLAEIAGKTLSTECLKDPEFLRAFFSTIDPQDFLPLVLKNLRAIREAYPSKWKEYRNLAIAIAVVNDSALPSFWPHHQVRSDLVPKDIPSVTAQFSRWIQANETRQLLLDPRRLSPGQLKFLVDAFLSPSETAWAQKNVRLSAGNFDKAFSTIRYREDRIKSKSYFWTDKPYTLEAISKNGGICVDQAYFAAQSGKALGLPTVMFNGQGSNGGHAWIGYMSGINKWELNCGRDPNQNLVTGIALDPQTWQQLSDHDLRQLAARFREKPEFLASTNDITMSEIFAKNGQMDNAQAALDIATRSCPENPEAWIKLGELLKKRNASVTDRILVHEKAVKALLRNPDAKVYHQQAIATIQRESGNNIDANQTERLILSQTLNSRSDLSCEIVAKRVKEALATEGIDKAALVFHNHLQSIGNADGGNFVKEVGVPFINALIQSGKKTRARRSIEIMRQKFEPLSNTPLDLLLRELTNSCK